MLNCTNREQWGVPARQEQQKNLPFQVLVLHYYYIYVYNMLHIKYITLLFLLIRVGAQGLHQGALVVSSGHVLPICNHFSAAVLSHTLRQQWAASTDKLQSVHTLLQLQAASIDWLWSVTYGKWTYHQQASGSCISHIIFKGVSASSFNRRGLL